jgi:hypothetical protein
MPFWPRFEAEKAGWGFAAECMRNQTLAVTGRLISQQRAASGIDAAWITSVSIRQARYVRAQTLSFSLKCQTI